MEEQANFENMWANPLQDIPTTKDYVDHQEYLYDYTEKVPGVCGGSFEVQYLGNRSTRNIIASVKVTVEYKGSVVHSEVKPILVPPGKGFEVNLGCTGWHNPTGADHTYYYRVVVGASWG